MLRSLRSRLIILLALALLPASTLAVIQAISNYKQLKALTERNLLQSSAILASEQKNEIISARDALAELARLPEVRGFTPGPCGQTLLRVRDQSDRYRSIFVVRLDGTLACSTNLDMTRNFSDVGWFSRTLQSDALTVSGRVKLGADDPPLLLATLPLRRDGGEVIGMVGMALKNSWLRDIFRQDEGGPSLENTSVALLDERGTVLAESAVDSELGNWMPATFVIGARLSGQAQVFQTEGRDGIERVFAIAPLYEHQVFIVLGGISGHLLPDPGFYLLAGLAYPVLMWAIALIVAWFAVDRLVLQQILRLRKTANAYAEGHFEMRTPGLDNAPQEIRDLGMTMHNMADVIGMHEEELRTSLQEQKTLLREVYHRVRNNLQVVSSLVNLQVSRAKNEHERAALRTTQDRIYALSMVHSNLYDTAELHRIKLAEFVPQLCEYLRQAQGEGSENVHMEFDIDPVLSDPERAVPLALLITEVVTNALTYDWPDGEAGQLTISIKKKADENLVMTVVEDGSPTESATPGSLGNRLIHAFAKQLGGEVRIETDNGFRLTLEMPNDQP